MDIFGGSLDAFYGYLMGASQRVEKLQLASR